MIRAGAALRLTGLAVLGAGLSFVVVAQLAGVRAVPVLSGSMTPYAPVGSLVLTARLAPADVTAGQVVAVVPPAPFVRDGHPVMHRVVSVEDVDGTPVMTTRGDANPQPDPWRIALPGADLGRAVAVLPWLGWAVMAGPLPALAVVLGGACAVEGVLSLRRRRGCSCSLEGGGETPTTPTTATTTTPTSLPPALTTGAGAPRAVVLDLAAPHRPTVDLSTAGQAGAPVVLPAPRRGGAHRAAGPVSTPWAQHRR